MFGGGPILGVASTSKAKTIREFNKKNHYNEWLFIYDPNSDRGGLLKGRSNRMPAEAWNQGVGNARGPSGGSAGQQGCRKLTDSRRPTTESRPESRRALAGRSNNRCATKKSPARKQGF